MNEEDDEERDDMSVKEYEDALLFGKMSVIEDFVKAEKARGERLCKRTQAVLYAELYEFGTNTWKEHCPPPPTEKYSSGRKASHFDNWGFFHSISFEPYEVVTNYAHVFCEQEIDAYAKSYRVLPENITPSFRAIVKVFDFKPEKI